MSSFLRLDWCSHDAAKAAVLRWHYSRRMPKSKLARIGVWEDGKFCGCVIYGVGAGNSTNGRRFGLADRWEMAELLRVALGPHRSPTSQVVAMSIRLIHAAYPGLKLLTSFADTAQGHTGTIYQASGWTYVGGREESNGAYEVLGRIVHPRTLHDRYGRGGQSIPWLRSNVDPKARRIRTPVKHQYLYPLHESVKPVIERLSQPYPKRRKDSSEPATSHVAEGGAAPTPALQHG